MNAQQTEHSPIRGIHHVTAIASDPQKNFDFYAGVLGLRLVKKTVNFDDPGTYHLYYGDEEGRPGTILTFFPWPGARKGILGSGQTAATAFSIPEGGIDFWCKRLAERGVDFEAPTRRFDEEVLAFTDPDGMRLELVAHAGAESHPPWHDGPIPEHAALRGFHGVTVWQDEPGATAGLLSDAMSFARVDEAGDRIRYASSTEEDVPAFAARIDVVAKKTPRGRVAAGSVHHIAWRARDERDELAWREHLTDHGQSVTPVLDRQYFRSIYFREPGGVLFEIATDPPGFTRDEPVETLGRELKLPPWLEERRDAIEAVLPPLREVKS